jgi:hypothetical protein
VNVKLFFVSGNGLFVWSFVIAEFLTTLLESQYSCFWTDTHRNLQGDLRLTECSKSLSKEICVYLKCVPSSAFLEWISLYLMGRSIRFTTLTLYCESYVLIIYDILLRRNML